MGLKWLFFPTGPLLLGCETWDQMEDGLASPYWGCSHFPQILCAHMNILFIVKVKILMHIKMVTHAPPIMLTIEPGTVIIFEHMQSNLF